MSTFCSVTDNQRIYHGRAMSAPMVRVSCLPFRVLSAKQGADGNFTEELVSLKLKKSVRELVTFPIPLTLLPVGFRLMAADIEKAITALTASKDENDKWEETESCGSTTLTSLYLHSVEDDGDQKRRSIGDGTCTAYDLSAPILAQYYSLDELGDEKKKEAVTTGISLFREHFGLEASSSSRVEIGKTTISVEALVSFLNVFSTHFLPPSHVIAHMKAIEYVQYDSFKKGFRRGNAATFLPKTVVNPFPEGDRRPEIERWGSVAWQQARGDLVELNVRKVPCARMNDIRCVQVICQLGASNPEDAAEAAAVIAEDVDGVDVNMGCPKAFSIQNGMGAALMKTPAMAGDLLRTIHTQINSREAINHRFSHWRMQPEVKSEPLHEKDKCSRSVAVTDGMIVPISFKTRIFGTTTDSVKHLSIVIANAIRHCAIKRPRLNEDTSNMDMCGGEHAASFPCPLHAVSLHARTRPQRSETDPLYEQADEIMRQLRRVEAVRVAPKDTSLQTTPEDCVKEEALMDNGDETYSVIMRDDVTDATPGEMGQNNLTIPLSDHIANMTFIFNGSVATNGRTAVPQPTFAGALIGRRSMWDPSVFNNYRYIASYEFASSLDDETARQRGAGIAPDASPIPRCVAMAHIPFTDLFAWTQQCNFGSPSEWLSMRKRATAVEKFSLQQLGTVFLDLTRHFAAFRKNTMYVKYYFTRTLSEFPAGKLTCREIEFLFLKDEDVSDTELAEIALSLSKVSGKKRGDTILFTEIQASNTWEDFHVTFTKIQNCDWGMIPKISKSLNSREAGNEKEVIQKAELNKQIKGQMSETDQFIHAVMQRGDHVLAEIPSHATLRK